MDFANGLRRSRWLNDLRMWAGWSLGPEPQTVNVERRWMFHSWNRNSR